MSAYDKDHRQRDTLLQRVHDQSMQLERDGLIDTGIKFHVRCEFVVITTFCKFKIIVQQSLSNSTFSSKHMNAQKYKNHALWFVHITNFLTFIQCIQTKVIGPPF